MNQPASESQRVSRRGFMVQAGSAGLALGVAPESSYAQSGGKGAMKITGIQTYKFSVPTGQEIRDPSTGELISSTAKPWLFLKITTNAGIVGWGEGSGEWLVPSVEATLHEWKPLLIGQDPLGVVRLTEDIQNRLPWKGGATFGTAIAAINIALYDIAGKAWGVPIHTILGGRKRHKVRVYTGGALFDSPETAVAQAKKMAEAGFAGVKGNPLETRTWPMDEAAVAHSVACVEAMRSAMGPHFDILLDTHGSPTPELSLDYARRVAPYKAALSGRTRQGGLDRGLAGGFQEQPGAHCHRREALYPERLQAHYRPEGLRRAAARHPPRFRDHLSAGDRQGSRAEPDADGSPRRRRAALLWRQPGR